MMEKQENHYHGIVNQTIQGGGLQTHFIPEPTPHNVYGMVEKESYLYLMEVVGYVVGIEWVKDKKVSVEYPVCRKVRNGEPSFYANTEIIGVENNSYSDAEYIGKVGGTYDFKTLSRLVELDLAYGDCEITPRKIEEMLMSEFNMTMNPVQLGDCVTIRCSFSKDGEMYTLDSQLPSFRVCMGDDWFPPVDLAKQMKGWNDFFCEENRYVPSCAEDEDRSQMEQLWSIAREVLDYIQTHPNVKNLEYAAIACRRIGTAKCFYDEFDLAVKKEYLGDTDEFLECCKKEGLVEVVGNIFRFNDLVEKLANYKCEFVEKVK